MPDRDPKFSVGEIVAVIPKRLPNFRATVLSIEWIKKGAVREVPFMSGTVVVASQDNFYYQVDPNGPEHGLGGLPWVERNLRKIDPPGEDSYEETINKLKTIIKRAKSKVKETEDVK